MEGWYHPWGTDPLDDGFGGRRTREAAHVLGADVDAALDGNGVGMIENPDRTPQDVAYAVARWLARGGSHMNYYMYAGGQHTRNGAAAGVLNSYADGVNIHADLQPNEPKRSHLARLHTLMAARADALPDDPAPSFLRPYNCWGALVKLLELRTALTAAAKTTSWQHSSLMASLCSKTVAPAHIIVAAPHGARPWACIRRAAYQTLARRCTCGMVG